MPDAGQLIKLYIISKIQSEESERISVLGCYLLVRIAWIFSLRPENLLTPLLGLITPLMHLINRITFIKLLYFYPDLPRNGKLYAPKKSD